MRIRRERRAPSAAPTRFPSAGRGGRRGTHPRRRISRCHPRGRTTRLCCRAPRARARRRRRGRASPRGRGRAPRRARRRSERRETPLVLAMRGSDGARSGGGRLYPLTTSVAGRVFFPPLSFPSNPPVDPPGAVASTLGDGLLTPGSLAPMKPSDPSSSSDRVARSPSLWIRLVRARTHRSPRRRMGRRQRPSGFCSSSDYCCSLLESAGQLFIRRSAPRISRRAPSATRRTSSPAAGSPSPPRSRRVARARVSGLRASLAARPRLRGPPGGSPAPRHRVVP